VVVDVYKLNRNGSLREMAAGERTIESFFCKVLRGDEIPAFFETGAVSVHFDPPLGCGLLDEDGCALLDWEARVSIVRLPDHRIVRVGSFTMNDLAEPPRGEVPTEFPRFVPELLVGNWILDEDSDLWPELRRIAVWLGFDYGRTTTSLPDDTAEIHGFRLFAGVPTDVEYFSEVVTTPWPFPDPRMGVNLTFAHVLEALNAWSSSSAGF